jgi:hypothetical protein
MCVCMAGAGVPTQPSPMARQLHTLMVHATSSSFPSSSNATPHCESTGSDGKQAIGATDPFQVENQQQAAIEVPLMGVLLCCTTTHRPSALHWRQCDRAAGRFRRPPAIVSTKNKEQSQVGRVRVISRAWNGLAVLPKPFPRAAASMIASPQLCTAQMSSGQPPCTTQGAPVVGRALPEDPLVSRNVPFHAPPEAEAGCVHQRAIPCANCTACSVTVCRPRARALHEIKCRQHLSRDCGASLQRAVVAQPGRTAGAARAYQR